MSMAGDRVYGTLTLINIQVIFSPKLGENICFSFVFFASMPSWFQSIRVVEFSLTFTWMSFFFYSFNFFKVLLWITNEEEKNSMGYSIL